MAVYPNIGIQMKWRKLTKTFMMISKDDFKVIYSTNITFM